MINALTTTMTDLDIARVGTFVLRWEKAGGKERANYQMFFAEMCDALGVDRPNPKGGPIGWVIPIRSSFLWVDVWVSAIGSLFGQYSEERLIIDFSAYDSFFYVGLDGFAAICGAGFAVVE
jgi:hypothetical protein